MSLVATRVAKYPSVVGQSLGDSCRVEMLDRRLRVLTGCAELVTEPCEGDLSFGIDDRSDAPLHDGKRVSVGVQIAAHPYGDPRGA